MADEADLISEHFGTVMARQLKQLKSFAWTLFVVYSTFSSNPTKSIRGQRNLATLKSPAVAKRL